MGKKDDAIRTKLCIEMLEMLDKLELEIEKEGHSELYLGGYKHARQAIATAFEIKSLYPDYKL